MPAPMTRSLRFQSDQVNYVATTANWMRYDELETRTSRLDKVANRYDLTSCRTGSGMEWLGEEERRDVYERLLTHLKPSQ